MNKECVVSGQIQSGKYCEPTGHAFSPSTVWLQPAIPRSDAPSKKRRPPTPATSPVVPDGANGFLQAGIHDFSNIRTGFRFPISRHTLPAPFPHRSERPRSGNPHPPVASRSPIPAPQTLYTQSPSPALAEPANPRTTFSPSRFSHSSWSIGYCCESESGN